MREFIVFLSLIYFSVSVSATDFSDTLKYKSSLKIKSKKGLVNERVFKKIESIHDTVTLQYMTVHEFKNLLGWIESKNNYRMINQSGFKGKYGTSDYMIIKLSKRSPTKFLKDSIEQERVMNESIFLYLRFIEREKLLKYLNRKISGMVINLEMLLAGCHFSPTYLEWFLMSNGKTDSVDGNISISRYMALFRDLKPKNLLGN